MACLHQNLPQKETLYIWLLVDDTIRKSFIIDGSVVQTLNANITPLSLQCVMRMTFAGLQKSRN